MFTHRTRFHLYPRTFTLAIIITIAFLITGGNVFAQPERQTKSFAEIAKKVGPAVVNIDTKSKVSQAVAKGTPSPADSDDIMDFFRRQLPQQAIYTVGSGFIVDKSGYILTNQHVIDDAARITVKLDSGEEFVARVVGADEETDLAVLKIDVGHDLPFLKFGDSEAAEVGDWVLAVGSPFGLAKSVTAGIISQTHRKTPYAKVFQRFIQTDAAINRGNSGGPLVNLDGDVIGVNSQIATTTGDSNGVGFALPSHEASFVFEQIVKNGKVKRGYLGANLEPIKTEFAKVYGLSDTKGAIITDVHNKQSPAGLALLQTGDVILEFNGQRVESELDLIGRVAATMPDQTVSVVYLRENGANLERKTATVKLGERPAKSRADEPTDRRRLPIDAANAEQKPFGLTLNELTPALAATTKLNGQKGLLVKEINPASFIADVRNSNGNEALGPGDLIQRINRVNITDLKTFTQIVAKLKVGDPVVLNVITYNPVIQSTELKILQFTVK